MNHILDRFRLHGRTAIVTGGGTGLGREMSLALSKAGADLVIAGRRPEPLREVADLIEGGGGNVRHVQTDITDSVQVNRLFHITMEDFGKVDILVNNAGMVANQGGKPIWEISDREWSEVVGSNLTGSFYCTRAVARQMVERGYGKIINVSSGFGLRGGRDNYTYASSKGGVIQLTRTLAVSLGKYGITSNCLVPGIFKTEGTAGSRETLPRPEFVPVGRIGDAFEIGPITVFLASAASNYMNGAMLAIDGGALAGGYAPTGYAPVIPLSEHLMPTQPKA